MIEVFYSHNGKCETRFFKNAEEFSEWNNCMMDLRKKCGDYYFVKSIKEVHPEKEDELMEFFQLQ